MDPNCCQDVIIYPDASQISAMALVADELIELSGGASSQQAIQLSATEVVLDQGFCSLVGNSLIIDNENCSN